MTEYIQLLKQHDWLYEYSDDHRVWKYGAEERAKLLRMQEELDPRAVTWNAFAPPRWRIQK